ncbi:MAG: OmpA family protein [Crocinitomicaceae bacterium]
MIATNSFYRWTLIFGAIFLSFCSLSQEVDAVELLQKKDGRTWRLAMEAKRTHNLYLAQNYLEQLYAKDSTQLHVVEELAAIYRLTHNYIKTEKFYTKILDSKKENKHAEALFYLGQAQKNNGKYPEAIESFNQFKKHSSGLGNRTLSKLYKTELEGCSMAIAYKDSIENAVVRNLGDKVNKRHIDFSPIPIGDNELIFGSYNESKERVYELIDSLPLDVLKRQFYLAEKKDTIWTKKGALPGPFNDPNMDIANGCYSLDGTRFYFTKCQENWQYNIICSIYESRLSNGKWSTPEMLPELVNSPDFTTTHPTMGRETKRNMEVLYFVSDREGTKGGMDIWYAEFDPRKKAFKKAKNAGSKLNTIGDELTPFYDLASKTMYFSTNGRPNFGGLDIYSMVGETSKWENPKNAGGQINSSADDLDFALKPSNRGGFFVSNRLGGMSLYHPTCCDDIYEFQYTKFISIEVDVDVTDVETVRLCKNGPVYVDLYLVDEEGRLLIEEKRNICDNARFNLRPNQTYVLVGKQEGYFPSEKMLSTSYISTSTVLKEKLVLEKQPLEPMILANIRYEFDSPNLTKESKNILDTTLLLIMNKYPNTKIEIMAHTDSKGSDEYNLKLSQKRAESVVQYLIKQGIDKNRLSAKGYGETLPIAPNENPDGSDNPAGREKNRRTEFKIIGEVEQEIIEYED